MIRGDALVDFHTGDPYGTPNAKGLLLEPMNRAARRPWKRRRVVRLITSGASGGKTIICYAETMAGWVASSLQSGDGITDRHARATDEAMACAGFGNCAITIVMDTASTDGAPKEITARRTVEFLAFLELPAEARALVIAAKKREFGEMEE